MSHFAEFDELLARPHQIDQWWEFYIDRARERLPQFSGAEWQAMQAGMLTRPEPWQVRLAQVLSGAPNPRSVPALVALALRGKPRVAYEAISGLNALAPEDFPSRPPPELKQRTIALKRELGEAEQAILTEFVERLDKEGGLG